MSTVAASATGSVDPDAEWESFRLLLLAQREDSLRQRELVASGDGASPGDPVVVGWTADLARTIEEIDAALDRIQAGTYGRCVRCRVAIPDERLEFRPHAAACVACAQSNR